MVHEDGMARSAKPCWQRSRTAGASRCVLRRPSTLSLIHKPSQKHVRHVP